MPLITSNTDLKSLSFGHDRPGGASSGQPFLFTGFDIPKVDFSDPSLQNNSGTGQNFFDIPPLTFNAPTFGFAPGASSVPTTLFNGDGVDIATPILNGLEGAATGIVNGAEGAINAVIGTINNSFDTTRNPSTPDFLWRKNRYNIAHSFADAVRITKFLTTPAGIFFILKQELLERQSTKTEGVTRIYSPANTIAQVGVNSIGYHLNKSGINPFERSYAEGGRNGYYWNTKNSISQLGVPNRVDDIGRGANRLTTLMLNKINRVATGFDQFGVTGVGNRDVLLRYNGGPGAPLGIGFTRISLTDPTREVELRKDKTIPGQYNTLNIDKSDYLTPIFASNGPGVAWYYNPFDTFGTIGERSVFQQFRVRNPDVDLNNLRNTWFGIDNPSGLLDRNTKIISSSLYSHPEALETGTAIGKKGTDSSKPEYYTPNGKFTVNWAYNVIKPTNKIPEQDAKTLSEALNNRNVAETGISKDMNDTSNNEVTFTSKQTKDKNSLGQTQTTDFGTSGLTDFRTILNSTEVTKVDYTSFNREKTYQTSKTSYKGNFIPGYGRVLSPNIPVSPDQETPVRGSDIIDFNFTLHVPGVSPNRLIDFTAYIEDWSDGVKAEWNSIKYMGRAESFYKYGGFSRDASVTFFVPTLSRRDLIANYKKLNALAWSVSPSYSDIGLMRGVITYFTMGDYFKKMPSIIKNIEFSQIADMGWDINRSIDGKLFGRGDSNYTGQLPKGIKVTVGFTPLHNYTPQVGSEYIGYDPDTVNSYPSIYTADPKGGQNAITSDSTLDANDRVPILTKPNKQLVAKQTPPPPASPLLQPQQEILVPGDINNDFNFGTTQGPTVVVEAMKELTYEDEERMMYTQETEATFVEGTNNANAAQAFDSGDYGPLAPTDAIPNQFNTPYGPSTQFNDVVTPGENPNYGSGPINTGFNF